MNDHTSARLSRRDTTSQSRDDSPVAVIASPSSLDATRQRRSYWAEVFAVARANPHTWMRVSRPFAEKTAAQIASDIRSAHRRDPDRTRLRGFLPGDRFDSIWERSDVGTDCFIYLKYIGLASDPSPSADGSAKP